MIADDDQFTLEALEADLKPRPRAPGQLNGRPKGVKNKLTAEINHLVKVRGIHFISKMWDRAERLEDEIDFKCAVWIGSRLWTKPRMNPVQIDLTQNVDARSLLAAVVEGQMTPADASSLWNSLSRNGSGPSAVAELAPKSDARERVARKLAGIVAARIAEASRGAAEKNDDEA